MHLSLFILSVWSIFLFSCVSSQSLSTEGSRHISALNESSLIDQVHPCGKTEIKLNASQQILFDYIVKKFGDLQKCETSVTRNIESHDFSTTTYNFEKKVQLIFSVSSPETLMSEIRYQIGLNEDEVKKVIQQATAKSGLKVDWDSVPEVKTYDGIVHKTYWDPDSVLNGRGYFLYKNNLLIAAGFGMAL